jgi:hypothetical protein
LEALLSKVRASKRTALECTPAETGSGTRGTESCTSADVFPFEQALEKVLSCQGGGFRFWFVFENAGESADSVGLSKAKLNRKAPLWRGMTFSTVC